MMFNLDTYDSRRGTFIAYSKKKKKKYLEDAPYIWSYMNWERYRQERNEKLIASIRNWSIRHPRRISQASQLFSADTQIALD